VRDPSPLQRTSSGPTARDADYPSNYQNIRRSASSGTSSQLKSVPDQHSAQKLSEEFEVVFYDVSNLLLSLSRILR
jgi:hypothetical protein